MTTPNNALEDFLSTIDISKTSNLLVGLSGGVDSMALTHMLALWSENIDGPEIHAVTVDHGLREESADEAAQAKERVAGFPKTQHHILKWSGKKPDTRVQETARAMRYDLMKDYALQIKARHIFVAHHQDDQAETLLTRLAKGSGLDGLACMPDIQEIEQDLFLCRPLLDYTHQELIKYCQENNLSWIEDPSNQNDVFLRPRLRKAREVLEKEGLSNKRLAQTAKRIARARKALEDLTDKAWDDIAEQSDEGCFIVFSQWKKQPEELRLRLILKAFERMPGSQDYGPRMEKVEALEKDLMEDKNHKTRTLGHCLISVKPKEDRLCFVPEK